MFIRSATMPLLLIAFIVSAYSGVMQTFGREGESGLFDFLLLGLGPRMWNEVHSTSAYITIALVIVHVLLDLKTLLWSIKYVFSFRKHPKA